MKESIGFQPEPARGAEAMRKASTPLGASGCQPERSAGIWAGESDPPYRRNLFGQGSESRAQAIAYATIQPFSKISLV